MPTSTVNPNTNFQTGTDQAQINSTFAPVQTPQSNITSPSAINYNDLTSSESANNFTPTPSPSVPNFNVGALAGNLPPQPLTQTEQGAQDLTTQLQGINNELAGKSQFEIQQAQKYGIGATTDANGNIVFSDPALIDLQNQYNVLQANAQNIPNQILNAASGRGVTTGGIDAQQTAALRNNAIQMNQVAAAMTFKQGNLATAQEYINMAVTAKYGPLQNLAKSLTSNLALIQNSPAYTLDMKNQAANYQFMLDQVTNQINFEREQWAAAQNSALEYTPVANAQQLRTLQGAGSPAQVASLAQQMGLYTPAQQQSLLQLEQTTNAIKQQPTDLALKQAQLEQALAVANAYNNPNLINAIQGGLINPSAINSRTLPFYSSLYNNLPQLNSVQANAAADFYENSGTQTKLAWAATTEKDFNVLRSLSAQIPRSDLPALNKAILAGETQIAGDPTATSFLQASNRVAASLGNVLGDSGGSDFRTKLANSVLDPSFSQATFDKVLGTESSLITNLVTSFQAQGNQPITGAQAPVTQTKNNNAPAPSNPQEGDTYNYNGTLYKVVNGNWVAQ